MARSFATASRIRTRGDMQCASVGPMSNLHHRRPTATQLFPTFDSFGHHERLRGLSQASGPDLVRGSPRGPHPGKRPATFVSAPPTPFSPPTPPRRAACIAFPSPTRPRFAACIAIQIAFKIEPRSVAPDPTPLLCGCGRPIWRRHTRGRSRPRAPAIVARGTRSRSALRRP